MNTDIVQQIRALKQEKKAVILAHYYTSDDIQALADYVGDSFYLAKVARQTDADVIVFCGVSFMGESAKILNPDKTVLMPDATADCPMAHMVADGKIEQMRKDYEDLAVVCYINSTAALKTQSDVCVTSSNAVKVVRALPQKNIFFIPDRNLGRFVAEMVPEKNIILNDGACPIHKAITVEELLASKARHPDAPVLAHPECRPEVVAMADFVGSTADIIAYARAHDDRSFIICTEDGVTYPLLLDSPRKHFHFPHNFPPCTDMKRNTPEKVLHVLQTGENAVEVSEEVRTRALIPLERMLALAK